MRIRFGDFEVQLSAEEIQQGVDLLRPETILEWKERLTQAPETVLLPFGLFPQPNVIHRVFEKA